MTIKKKYLLVALSLALVICITYATTIFLAYQNQSEVKRMNIAGKQRMLSQRIAYLLIKLQQNGTPATYDTLRKLLHQWKNVNMVFLEDNKARKWQIIRNPKTIEKLKNTLKQIEEVESFIQQKKFSPAVIQELEDILNSFLLNMDDIVVDLESDPEAYTKRLLVINTILVIMFFIILYFGFRYIIIPTTIGLKAQNEAMYQVKSKLGAILDNSDKINLLISLDYKILYFNKVANDVKGFNLQKDYVLGADIRDYLYQEDINMLNTYLPKVVEGEKFVLETVHLVDNQETVFELTYLPVYGEDGLILGCNIKLQDITDRKTKELELIEIEERLQKTIEAMPNALLIIKDSTIQFTNKNFEQVFGYTESEVIGKSVDFLIPERFRKRHKVLQDNYTGSDGSFRQMGRFLPALTKSGEEIIADINLNTFMNKGQKWVIVILEDVTELKKRQDVILKQNEAFRSIAWIQSHELRRPVANILGLCSLLLNYEHETEERKNQYVSYMLQEVVELDKIVHKIVAQANESDYEDNEIQ